MPVLKMAPPQHQPKPSWFVETADRLRMFDPNLHHFADWRLKFQEFLEARELTDEAVVKELLRKAMPEGQLKILEPICRPREPLEMPVKFILDKLQLHFKKITLSSRLKERCEFFKAKQGGKSLEEFAISLKRMTFSCDFGQFEDEAILTAFVMGLDDPILQKYLIKNEITDLDEAIEISRLIQHLLPKEMPK